MFATPKVAPDRHVEVARAIYSILASDRAAAAGPRRFAAGDALLPWPEGTSDYGRGLRHRDGRGRVIVDDSYLLLHSGGCSACRAPQAVILDTARVGGAPDAGIAAAAATAGTDLPLGARTSLLLRVQRG